MVNPATLEFEAIANANLELKGGAGIHAAQLVVEKGPAVILTGSCGPNARQVIDQAGIQLVTGVSGTVSRVVQQFTSGSLKTTPAKQKAGQFSGGTDRRQG